MKAGSIADGANRSSLIGGVVVNGGRAVGGGGRAETVTENGDSAVVPTCGVPVVGDRNQGTCQGNLRPENSGTGLLPSE